MGAHRHLSSERAWNIPQFSNSLPFILVHILYNVGLHSYPVGGQEAPSCGLLLYEAGTDSALCVVGFVSFRMGIQHHVDTLVSTPHCNGPRCCDHGGPRSQGLSFCLAGIEAASWKNVVKDFDVAQQKRK